MIPVQADITTWEGNVAACDAARNAWGRIDVFVGNAGMTNAMLALEAIPGADLGEAFDEFFAMNVLAPTLGVRAAMEDLIATRGWVNLTGSFASSNAAGGGVLYTASKHAVLGLVRQLAYELAPDVRVNGVAPASRLPDFGVSPRSARTALSPCSRAPSSPCRSRRSPKSARQIMPTSRTQNPRPARDPRPTSA